MCFAWAQKPPEFNHCEKYREKRSPRGDLPPPVINGAPNQLIMLKGFHKMQKYYERAKRRPNRAVERCLPNELPNLRLAWFCVDQKWEVP